MQYVPKSSMLAKMNQPIRLAVEVLQHIVESHSLTLCRPMDFSIKLDTFKSGWSIIYVQGPTGYNF